MCMKTENIDKLKILFDRFKTSRNYLERVRNSQFCDIAKIIISQSLNEKLTNEKLTGLIQIFKVKSSNSTIKKYLEINLPKQELIDEIYLKITSLDVRGYTAAGKFIISNMSEEDLEKIKTFLKLAFEVDNIEQATKLCREFENLNLPQIKPGIYSPWLHYINPHIFPIINSSNKKFRKWMDFRGNYSDMISQFGYLNQELKLNDLGILDSFIYFNLNDLLDKKDQIELLIWVMSLSDEKLSQFHQLTKDNKNNSAEIIKKEFNFRNDIDEESHIQRFWLLGAYTSLRNGSNMGFSGNNEVKSSIQIDRTEYFVNNGIWIHGFNDRLKDDVNRIKIGDKVAIKSVFVKDGQSVMRIKSIGHVTGNLKDGRTLKIDWSENFEQFNVDFTGGYWSTISEVKKEEHISKIWI